MLDVSGRGSQRARLIVPLDSVPPNTVPPSPDKTTLPIQAKPPKTSSPHQTRRAIRLREGDSTPGGWFCRRRVILPNPTSSFNQPPNHSTLQIPNTTDHSQLFRPLDSGHKQPFRPPQTTPPSQFDIYAQITVHLLKPGRSFRPRRVITSAPKARPGKTATITPSTDKITLPEPFHPPNPQPNRQSPTIPPSPDKNTLPIPPKPAKSSRPHQTRRAIPHREGENVRQTNTTSKNTRQHHPPRTVPPSKSPTQPTIPDRSTLSIQNTATVPPS